MLVIADEVPMSGLIRTTPVLGLRLLCVPPAGGRGAAVRALTYRVGNVVRGKDHRAEVLPHDL